MFMRISYQLILIGGYSSENGLWKDVGAIFFSFNVGDWRIGAVGPDD